MAIFGLKKKSFTNIDSRGSGEVVIVRTKKLISVFDRKNQIRNMAHDTITKYIIPETLKYNFPNSFINIKNIFSSEKNGRRARSPS